MNTIERILIFAGIMIAIAIAGNTLEFQNKTIIENQTTIISQNKTIMVKVGSLYRNQKAPLDGIGDELRDKSKEELE